MPVCKYVKTCIPKNDGLAECGKCPDNYKNKKSKKMVTVKAWICESELRTVEDGHYGIIYGKKGLGRTPCTITIETKYLKGDK